MLCSCSPGIYVENIDSGLDAAAALGIHVSGRDCRWNAAEKDDR